MNPKITQAFKQWLPILTVLVSTVYLMPYGTKWIPMASGVVWGIVRLFKDDTKIPGVIPPAWRPVVTLGLSTVASGIDLIVAGVPMKTAILRAIMVTLGAIGVHVYGVDVLGGGRDLPLPPSNSGSDPYRTMPTIPPKKTPPVDLRSPSPLWLGFLVPLSMLIAMTSVCFLDGCSVLKPIVREVLTDGEIACIFSSELNLPEAVASVCQIDKALVDSGLVDKLLQQRNAARKAGVHWSSGALPRDAGAE